MRGLKRKNSILKQWVKIEKQDFFNIYEILDYKIFDDSDFISLS